MESQKKKVFVTLSNDNPDATATFPRRTFWLTQDKPVVQIGRASSKAQELQPAADNCWFDSPVMSRQHAQLRLDGDKETISISDYCSLHGTSVNNSRLKPNEPRVLYDGDTLRFGAPVERGREMVNPYSMRFYSRFLRSSSRPAANIFRVPDDSDIEDLTGDEDPAIQHSAQVLQRHDIHPFSGLQSNSSLPKPIDLTHLDEDGPLPTESQPPVLIRPRPSTNSSVFHIDLTMHDVVDDAEEDEAASDAEEPDGAAGVDGGSKPNEESGAANVDEEEEEEDIYGCSDSESDEDGCALQDDIFTGAGDCAVSEDNDILASTTGNWSKSEFAMSSDEESYECGRSDSDMSEDSQEDEEDECGEESGHDENAQGAEEYNPCQEENSININFGPLPGTLPSVGQSNIFTPSEVPQPIYGLPLPPFRQEPLGPTRPKRPMHCIGDSDMASTSMGWPMWPTMRQDAESDFGIVKPSQMMMDSHPIELPVPAADIVAAPGAWALTGKKFLLSPLAPTDCSIGRKEDEMCLDETSAHQYEMSKKAAHADDKSTKIAINELINPLTDQHSQEAEADDLVNPAHQDSPDAEAENLINPVDQYSPEPQVDSIVDAPTESVIRTSPEQETRKRKADDISELHAEEYVQEDDKMGEFEERDGHNMLATSVGDDTLDAVALEHGTREATKRFKRATDALICVAVGSVVAVGAMIVSAPTF